MFEHKNPAEIKHELNNKNPSETRLYIAKINNKNAVTISNQNFKKDQTHIAYILRSGYSLASSLNGLKNTPITPTQFSSRPTQEPMENPFQKSTKF